MPWRLVYAHDAEGRPTDGDISSLIDLIRNGCPIRFSYESEERGLAATDATWIYLRNGIVYAENTSNISDVFDGPHFRIKESAYHWFVIVSTSGERHVSRWNVGEHTLVGETNDRMGLRWFADRCDS